MMNLRIDEIEDFIKTNVPLAIENKNGKQISFSDQLSSHATANPRNQGASSSLPHNVNHVHIDDEVVKFALALSSLRRGKDLSDPYKDHPFHKAR